MDKFIRGSNLNYRMYQATSTKYKKQKLKELKGDLDESTIITGGLKRSIYVTERTT